MAEAARSPRCKRGGNAIQQQTCSAAGQQPKQESINFSCRAAADSQKLQKNIRKHLSNVIPSVTRSHREGESVQLLSAAMFLVLAKPSTAQPASLRSF
jgi:hypothetical protein